MARFHGHGDKVAYFFIAVGVYLLAALVRQINVFLVRVKFHEIIPS